MNQFALGANTGERKRLTYEFIIQNNVSSHPGIPRRCKVAQRGTTMSTNKPEA